MLNHLFDKKTESIRCGAKVTDFRPRDTVRIVADEYTCILCLEQAREEVMPTWKFDKTTK